MSFFTHRTPSSAATTSSFENVSSIFSQSKFSSEVMKTMTSLLCALASTNATSTGRSYQGGFASSCGFGAGTGVGVGFGGSWRAGTANATRWRKVIIGGFFRGGRAEKGTPVSRAREDFPADRALPAATFEDLQERPRSQLVGREPALLERLRLRDRAAPQRPQEDVEQALPRRRVVEDVADERRLAGLGEEVGQPLGGGLEALEEEGVEGGVARDELRGVQVPALVEADPERGADVVVVHPPRAVHDVAPADRHDVRRAVGEEDAAAG